MSPRDPVDTGIHLPPQAAEMAADTHRHRELQEIVRAAVGEALQAHVCRFPQSEAGNLHMVARLNGEQIDSLRRMSKMSDAQLSALARLADALNSASVRISQTLVIAAFVGAVLVLTRLIKMGLIDP